MLFASTSAHYGGLVACADICRLDPVPWTPPGLYTIYVAYMVVARGMALSRPALTWVAAVHPTNKEHQVRSGQHHAAQS